MTRNLSRMGTAFLAVALAALLAGCPGQPRPTAGLTTIDQRPSTAEYP